MGEWGKMFLGEKWPKIHDWIVGEYIFERTTKFVEQGYEEVVNGDGDNHSLTPRIRVVS